MNGTYLKYAKNVGKIGESMQKTANKFGELAQRNPEGLEEVKVVKEGYISALEEFKRQRKEMNNLVPPSIVKDEHDSMVQSFDKYINGTSLAIDSLDTENVSTDQELFVKGKRMQDEASTEIVAVTKIIAEKLF